MQKFRKRNAVVLSLAAVTIMFAGSAAQAEEAEAPYEEVMEASDGEVNPCADQIEYIYRIHKGRKQRRRWNYTQGEWYDKKWEDLGPV